MVTTVTVAMPAMMFIARPMMTVMLTVVSVMAVMTVMQQRPQGYKRNRRTNNAVVMMGLGRYAGQGKYKCSTCCNRAKFVSCQVNHYYLPLCW